MYEFKTEFDEGFFTIWYAKQEDIDNIIYPEAIDELIVYGDYFDSIKIPDGVKTVHCVNVCLKEIYVPDSVEYLYVCHNKLSRLELPANITVVDANSNIIREVVFRDPPTKLYEFNLMNNRLQKLDFVPPKTLELFNIYGNKNAIFLTDKIIDFINKNEFAYYINPPPLDD